jgi:long-subunit acyl-CoA synthetase (AMP-forming)
MSELSGTAAMNPPGRIKLGTVGPPLPGIELRLADDGELLCRGEQVMRGYRDDPVTIAEAIDGDGWLHTGDVATIDADGYVRIVDRKKELIINAAGKNMSPVNIEATLKASSPLIGQAVVIGDRRP